MGLNCSLIEAKRPFSLPLTTGLTGQESQAAYQMQMPAFCSAMADLLKGLLFLEKAVKLLSRVAGVCHPRKFK